MAFFLILLTCGLTGVFAIDDKPYNGKEAWGYVNVRKDAYMFWWLYYTDASVNYSDYPLVIWLQGGPGASSTGFGNFEEIGPLDSDLKSRNTSWVKKANLLFLDNPVGTGFSYVTNPEALAKTNIQIAEDLVTTFKSLMANIPEFQKSPVYIFGESYGGKMAIDFTYALYNSIKTGKIVCNLKGVALGDSWISPVDSVATWGQYLYTMSMISSTQLKALDEEVKALRTAMAKGQFSNATEYFSEISDIISRYSNGVDFYNILKHVGPPIQQAGQKAKLKKLLLGKFTEKKLDDLMNGPIRDKLHVIPKNVTWGGQSNDVMAALNEDFMKSVVESVDKVLNKTNLSVDIYSGQLDLIVDTLGTLQWVHKLQWPGLKSFLAAERVPFTTSGSTEGFQMSFKNLRFFWILKSGHMVPSDAGCSALQMLDMIINQKKIQNFTATV